MAKILHFISGKGLGGPKTVFLAQQKIFQLLNYDAIPVLRPNADLAAYLPQQTQYFSYPRISLSFFRPLILKHISSYTKTINPDIIWLHKPIDTFLWRQACPNKLIVLVVHGYQNKYLKYADFLIAVSPSVLSHLKNLGFNNVFLLNNFLSHNITNHPITWNHPIKFGALGYYRRKKGFTDWIKSLYMLEQHKELTNQYEAHLCGHGQLYLLLKLLKSYYKLHHFSMHPWQKDSQKWISSMDVVIVPSRSESFGMVIIEAMAQGILVVATRSGGPQTIIEDKKTGILIDPKNPKELYQTMHQIINNPTKYNDIRENGRFMVQNNYSLQVAKQTMKNILFQILK